MFYFVEYLRASRALRIAFILLAALFLIAVAIRLSIRGASVDTWTNGLESSPTAHVTRTQLPDGSTRIVVDDPKQQTHAVILQHGQTIEADVLEPKSQADKTDLGRSQMGSLDVNTSLQGDKVHTVVHFHYGDITYSLGVLFMVTIPMGLIIASLLGGTLAKENDGHIELAWTKPVSRERLALANIAVDCIAIVLSQLCTIAVLLLASFMFFVPRFSYDSVIAAQIALGIFAPLAWYALITAASSSVKRGPGGVIGAAWAAGVIAPGLAGALSHAHGNAVVGWFYAVFKGISFIDPIAYLSFTGGYRNAGLNISIEQSALVLIGLSIIYLALSVAQWRRLEA